MKMKIKFKYKSKTASDIWFESGFFKRKETLIHVDDLMKTGRVVDLEIIDEMGNSWTRKEYIKLNQELEKEPENIVVFFDGGFDKETNYAGAGIVIYYEKGGESFRIRKNALLEEIENNNEAEYAALHIALGLLEEIGVKNVPCTIKGDSQVAMKQLGGEWPCYEEGLSRWLDRIEGSIQKLGLKPNLIVLNRKDNKEADKLANQALQGIKVHSNKRLE
ncbi:MULTISPECIES: reverse transcriptase-like protein [Rossellomorea]|uniref:reverse transcriptase-like protein n=1 Tax=Rossellomorea TaxID=2837508 RepID=UPI001CCE8C25|nr:MULTISPECIES: reverse transcriptase-like protein [Rossellomorea]MCA0147884.1 reverse transcriptase-like protein [Rossellomorea vietnamensis]UTE76083.1 reverse transcriptase-like protein [Rossellomorea sp. KS-H15a]WGG43920.1 reverse transcriptase-like protein [Rossellomorea sp. DA94]